MNAAQRFEAYLAHLAEGLGHADRHAGLRGYCTGLMLPLKRKRVEPIAASVDPLPVSARHQSLHHFVAKSGWSDDEMLRRVREWIRPKLWRWAASGSSTTAGFRSKGNARWVWRGRTAEQLGKIAVAGVRRYSRDALRNGSP